MKVDISEHEPLLEDGPQKDKVSPANWQKQTCRSSNKCGTFARLLFIYVIIGLLLSMILHIGIFPPFVGTYHACKVYGTSDFKFEAAGNSVPGLSLSVPLSTFKGHRIPVVFFGGNMEDITGAAKQIQSLLTPISAANNGLRFQAHNSVYRGYPGRSGWASQSGLVADGKALVSFVLRNGSNHGIKRVLIVGQSLGSAVAIQVAAALPGQVAGVLLSAPWSTLWQMTLDYLRPLTWLTFPWVWFVAGDEFDSLQAMAALPAEIPIAVLNPEEDSIIPPYQHRKVFEASHANLKWWVSVPGAGHDDTCKMAKYGGEALAMWAVAATNRMGSSGSLVSSYDSDNLVLNSSCRNMYHPGNCRTVPPLGLR